MTRIPGRDGVAVVAAVMLLLAVTLLAHGLLLLADLEVETSRAGLASVAARLAAQEAATRLASDTSGADRSGIPVWGVADSSWSPMAVTTARGAGIPSGGMWGARLVRLSRELWLSEGRARLGPLAERHVARPVWIADPAARVAALGAVVVSGDPDSTDVAGAVDATAFWIDPPVAPPISCASGVAAVDSLWAAGPPGLAVLGPGTLGPVFGPLTLDSLAVRAPVVVGGSGTPGPRTLASSCLPGEPWSWGDPGRPWAPCGSHLAFVAGDAGLEVSGGVGQGLLVLRGAATLTDHELHGVVLAEGPLDLLGSTRIEGFVWSARGIRIGPDASVVGSACWAVTALRHPALATPSPVPDAGWLYGR